VRPSWQELIGREAECFRIAGLLQDARRQRSAVLVVLGEPGIGKSALLGWAAARADGMRVLSARGMESEADLPFAALSELCGEDLDGIGRLPGPQAAALERALARRPGPAGDRFAVGAAVLGLLGLLAERAPVVVAVDDLQWVDQASKDALLFALRRLRNARVAAVLATRPGGLDADAAGLPSLPLQPLDAGGARALLEAEHGELPPPVAEALLQAACGNPLALREIARMLTARQLAGREPIDTPLPAGPTLEQALAARLAGLPAPTLRSLLVAAASDTERLQPIVDAIGALGLGAGAEHLEPAERAGVVAIAGERLTFAHPLLRAAVYHRAADPERRAAHRALAAAADGEARTWHLARATVGEDPALAATLEEIGVQARLRGAPGAAASALQRAAQLTPPGPERARRLTAAAGDAYVAGRQAAALEMLDEASGCADGPGSVSQIDLVRGRILVLRGEPQAAFRLLVGSAASVRGEDPASAAALLAEATLDCLGGGEIPVAVATARDAVRLAERAAPPVRAFAGCMLAASLALTGETAEAGALIDGAVPLLLRADPLTEAGALLAQTAQCCIWLERHELASLLLERLVRTAREAGAPTALPWPLVSRAVLGIRLGRWSSAAADAGEGVDLAEQTGQLALTAYALDCLARVAAARGREDECRRHAARAVALVERHDIEPGRVFVPSTLGLLELGLGRAEPAVAHLEAARAATERCGVREPRAALWQADLVEALVRGGDPAAGEAVLEDLEDQAQRTGGRWTLGAAARCRGLLAPPGEAEEHFGGGARPPGGASRTVRRGADAPVPRRAAAQGRPPRGGPDRPGARPGGLRRARGRAVGGAGPAGAARDRGDPPAAGGRSIATS
jgi:tetratricopeptide (TPR) repeat protein